MATKLIWGADLYKGFKIDPKQLNKTNGLFDVLPFQMLTQEEKTQDWIQAIADFYDNVGFNNVQKRAPKMQRNYDMRVGRITPSDYIINPTYNEYHQVVGMFVPHETQSPLEQFYPLAPNFVDVLRGEYIKRDNTWTVQAIDHYSKSQVFENKKTQFEQAIAQMTQLQKQQSLYNMGLTEENDPERYQQEMSAVIERLHKIELESKSFRTTGVKWAEKVINIHEQRYNLHELGPDGFESGLITDSEFWHLDLLEDDFKIELLNPMYCDYHKGPNTKYVSDGDYFLYFDFLSAGDVVNRYGRRMKEEDILKFKSAYLNASSHIMLTDQEKNLQGAYYDLTKSYKEATDLNPVRNDVFVGRDLARSYAQNSNFQHNLDVPTDLFGHHHSAPSAAKPQMFRVMRLYWRSMMRIGWLTRVHRDGTIDPGEWIDENHKVTIEPEYDVSIVKQKTKDNLLYGEHIDWTWAPQWRHVMKISPNGKHSYWDEKQNHMDSVYIDGGPLPFQFKGRTNAFDSLPPVEGCFFNHINSTPHSFIDRIRPLQIIYNICMNKVPRQFLDDNGLKVAIDKRSYSVNDLDIQASGLTPREEYEERLRSSPIIEYMVSRDAAEGMGQPALPQVISLSTVQEAQMYFRLGQEIKMEAGEIIGISRQRLGKNMASDTATGINQGIEYSETQTEKYYEQHSNLMQRVRQRMLDATQYYSTFHETTREVYMNEMDETVMLNIEGTDNMLTHYNIFLQSRANVRSKLNIVQSFLQQENTLPIAPSAKLDAMISNSIPKILDTVRKSELELADREEKQAQAERDMQQKAMEDAARQQAENRLHDDTQKQLDRDNVIEVATIKALGGIQTDNNKDGQLDALQNLDPFFKQQELNEKRRATQTQNDIKRQVETDKLIVEREKAQKDLEGKKYVADTNLKIAKENTRKKG